MAENNDPHVPDVLLLRDDEHMLVENEDSDSDDDDHHDPPREHARAAPRPRRGDRIALHDFFRLLAGGQRLQEAPAESNEELLANLRRSSMIQRVLDVGCGCGLVAACAAYMAGRTGEVVGIDIRKVCIQLSRDNVRRLQTDNTDFTATAGDVRFEVCNVFLPTQRHKGRYDKVHVGATCPEARLGCLLALLRPEGGLIMVPVNSDLRIIKKAPDGSITQKIVSQVRFQSLEVPSDAEIVKAAMESEARALRCLAVPDSTFTADMQSACGGSSSTGGSCHQAAEDAPADTSSGHAPPRSVCAEGSMLTDEWRARLGDCDCHLVGSDWRLPAHKALLKERVELFRARCGSGMRDAEDGEVRVPEHLSCTAAQALLHYCYHDCLPPECTPEQQVELLHAATYFGVPRLAALCEKSLAAVVVKGDADDAAEGAIALLNLADEHGLLPLRNFAVSYIAEHYERVAAKEGFRSLSCEQVALVAAHLSQRLRRFQTMLADLSNPPPLPSPS